MNVRERNMAIRIPKAVKKPRYRMGNISETPRLLNPVAVVREATATGDHNSDMTRPMISRRFCRRSTEIMS